MMRYMYRSLHAKEAKTESSQNVVVDYIQTNEKIGLWKRSLIRNFCVLVQN